MKNFFTSLTVSLGAIAVAVAGASGYQVIKKMPIPDDGGWDYQIVDSAARRLYVSHSTMVEVLDVDSGAIVGKIPKTEGVHGIALGPELGRGFTSNGRAATVTIFDLKTLERLCETKTSKNPDAILYDPATRRVFTFNGGSLDSTTINASDGTAAGTIALGGKPEFAVSDGQGKVFVNLEDKSVLLGLDPHRLTVKNRWPLAPCKEPTGMAMDKKNQRLFIGCHSKVMVVVNPDTGRVVASLPIGSGVDATAFDPETALIFYSNGDGTTTVIHEDSPDRYSVVDSIKTQVGSRTMALDLKTHQLFLPAAEFGPIPTPRADQPRSRSESLPGTFSILVVGR